MVTSEVSGQGRITVFSMFGPVFACAARIVDGRQTAFIGPVTPGVGWRTLWKMSARCGRIVAAEQEKARWVITQANRALICGDAVVNLADSKWEMVSDSRVALEADEPIDPLSMAARMIDCGSICWPRSTPSCASSSPPGGRRTPEHPATANSSFGTAARACYTEGNLSLRLLARAQRDISS